MRVEITHASLFSGIGAAELAAKWMGWRNAFHCEIQEFPRTVLRYWFPEETSYEDITKTDFAPWRGKIDVLTGVFRVNPSVVQERDRERTMTVTSGRRCYARYGRYIPLGSLARTLLESSRWYSPAVSLRWEAKPLFSERITRYGKDGSNMSSRPSVRTLKTRDIPSNRLLFRLVPSARRTGGTGYGSSQGALLPTCQTQWLKQCNKDGKTKFMPLELLPTPTAIDSGSGRMNRSMSANAKERPTIALAAKMGSPHAECGGGGKYARTYNPDSQMGRGLTALAVNGMLPTPTARDYHSSHSSHAMTRKDGKTRTDMLSNLPAMLGNHSHQTGGETSQLNPLFVEDMMGFPLGWTTLPFLGRDGGRKA